MQSVKCFQHLNLVVVPFFHVHSRACGKDPKSDTVEVPGMENPTGLCPRVIVDTYKFAVAAKVVDEKAYASMCSQDFTNLKELVSYISATNPSARVSLVFKSQTILRLGVAQCCCYESHHA